MERIREYGRRARIQRQVMSNNAQFYAWVNGVQNFLTVVVTSLLGFIGFSGLDKIQSYIGWTGAEDKARLEMLFNFTVFGLFVLATLHLVFHFGKKQTDAERAVVSLTTVINHVDDLLFREEFGLVVLGNNELEGVRYRYDVITQGIPATSDQSHKRAKDQALEKELKRTNLVLSPQALFDEQRRVQALKALIFRSAEIMEILQALRQVDPKLHLGGGLIRNLVWDYLHDFKSPTPVDDVDVVYFDSLSTTKQHDLQIESKLKGQVPNLHWSVKNQARMHLSNGDAPSQDLVEAVTKWPETATAIAVRLTDTGELQTVVPHGLSDLFRLLVRPTPNFTAKPQRVTDRVAQKRWQTIWPKLEVLI